LSGLNCGTVSSLAWPYIERGLDAAIAIEDNDAIRAARDLATRGVPAGPCGGAALAALRSALFGPDGQNHRDTLGIGPTSTVAVLITEGSDANPLPA
jgi:diaminopropionate ammonia-lyase